MSRFAARKAADGIRRDLLAIAGALEVGGRPRIYEFRHGGERFYVSHEGDVFRRWVIRPAQIDFLYQRCAEASDLDVALSDFAKQHLGRA